MRPVGVSGDGHSDSVKEADVGLISKAVKAGLAKQAVDAARKPHNQRKIKSLVSSLMGKGSRA